MYFVSPDHVAENKRQIFEKTSSVFISEDPNIAEIISFYNLWVARSNPAKVKSGSLKTLTYGNTAPPGTDVMIFEIFSHIFLPKNWHF
jgi:hypothetical protein